MSVGVVTIILALALALPAIRLAGAVRRRGPRHVGLCTIARIDAIRREAGPAVADAIVATLADRLRAIRPIAIRRVTTTEIEFALTGPADAEAAAELDRAAMALADPVAVDDYIFHLPVRIGYANHPDGPTEDILAHIRDALLTGPGGRHARRIEGETGSVRSGILRDLQRAIADDLLALHYQPKLDCRGGTIRGVEALLRWNHPRLGRVPPDLFVRIAEETGLIGPLTDWVVDRALADHARLTQAGRPLLIFVNISGILLPDEAFAARLLAKVGGRGDAIGIEITETGVIDDPDRALANLAAFRAAGLEIAIDDYGSGLSSLAYLKQLPATELKIDKLFVSGLTTSHRDPLLVRSSIDLAHALGMKVTAEGVENPMALSLLSIMGCDMAQGYHISHPLSFGDLVAFLERDEKGSRPATPTLPFHAAAPRRFV